MFRFSTCTSLLSLALLVGCAGSTPEEASGASAGAATASNDESLAGSYDGHQQNTWQGSLDIKDGSDEIAFSFEISAMEPNARIGTLSGFAARKGDGYTFHDDDGCLIDFTPLDNGDLDVTTNTACALALDIVGHGTSQTALDFTATWKRL